MAPTSFLFLAAFAFLFVTPFPVLAQNYDSVRAALYTCPPSYLVLIQGTSPTAPVECDPDPCYTDAVGCGPGNVCVQTLNRDIFFFTWEHECTCNPPYVRGVYYGFKSVGDHSSCYIPGQDICSPNPCQNGGNCTGQVGIRNDPVPAADGIIDFTCTCPPNFLGKTCALPGPAPTPVLKSAPPPPPPGSQGVCGTGPAAPFPTQCYFSSDLQGRYVCCDTAGCDGFNPPDFVFPHCKAEGYAPPDFGVGSPSTPRATPPPSSPPPSGSQGVCGSGSAADFPTRCYFNSDPHGRYVCCDGQGCDGFNSDNLTPHCKNFGYVPPNFGAGSSPPPTAPPPSGSQGVCGTGTAASFPVRCWYNNDPQGRYVCCDSAGCDGFNPPDFFFPHCKNSGFVPPVL